MSHMLDDVAELLAGVAIGAPLGLVIGKAFLWCSVQTTYTYVGRYHVVGAPENY